jgi:hypothetical protein
MNFCQLPHSGSKKREVYECHGFCIKSFADSCKRHDDKAFVDTISCLSEMKVCKTFVCFQHVQCQLVS